MSPSFEVFFNVLGTVLGLVWMFKKNVLDKEPRNRAWKEERGKNRLVILKCI